MNGLVKAARKPTESPEKSAISQIIFVVIGLGIITGGIWTLYMGDAPYHPQDQMTRDNFSPLSD